MTLHEDLTRDELRQILVDALATIEDPARWTQGWFAKDAAGYRVEDYHRYATCFCVWGAIRRARYQRYGHGGITDQMREVLNPIAWGLVPELSPGSGSCPTTYINDHVGHAKTIELLKLGIESLSTG